MNVLRDLNESVARRGVSVAPPGAGLTLARAAMALARNPHAGDAVADAEATWGVDSRPARVLQGLQAKAAVGAGSTQSGNWLAPTAEHRIAAAEFVQALRPLTILGRMSGYRRLPQQVKIPRMTAGATVGWVGEARPAPVSAVAIDTITLDNYKIGGIVTTTLDLVRLSSVDADALVREDLLAAVAAMTDRAMVDPAAAAVPGVSPASITNGALQVPATGATLANAAADLKLLFDELTSHGIPLAAPYFLMAPETAVGLSLLNVGGAGFLDLGTRGNSTIATVPVLASAAVPTDVIVLLDAAELLVCDSDDISLDLSQHATIQLNSTPDYPATAATVMTSLFAANLVAWRVVRPINWLMRRAHAVATLTGVSY